MDTEEYHDDSMAESGEDVEEEEERYGYYNRYGYNDHECKECAKCTSDASYEYIGALKPVIFTGVPKLIDIAAVSVAVALWRHKNITRAISRVSRKCAKDSEKWKTLCIEVPKLPEQLPVPKSIQDYILKYVNEMVDCLTNWVSYHFRTVFLKEGQDKALYKLIHRIAWYPNGAINYKQTAVNMLTSVRLSDVEKFKFLATYCLKDEIQLLPSALFDSSELEYVNFSEYPLIYYWYCYFRNELQKIPVTGNLSVDIFMFRYNKVDNWFAKEYFFDQMSSEEQTLEAVRLIDQRNEFYERCVLLKLNEAQRLLVCMERPIRITKYYARTKVNYEELISIWFEIRNLISDDQFLCVVRVLVEESTVDDVMMKIYSSASDDFKCLLLSLNDHEYVDKIFTTWKWATDSELVFAMLQDANDDVRKSISMQDFFSQFCKKLLDEVKYPKFNRLMNLCFLNIQDSVQFKLDLAGSTSVKNKCLRNYMSGNLEDFNDVLNLLLSNSNVILNYKRDLLMSPEAIETCVKILDSETDILSTIIADASLCADTATAFKKLIMLSSSAICKFKKLISNGQLTKVQSCMDRYLASNEGRIFQKTVIPDPAKLMLYILNIYRESYWQALILWYYGDENLVRQFKRKLNVDSMFIDMLKASVFQKYDVNLRYCKFHHPIKFDKLDRFLNWYFQSSSEVMKYKMNKIDKFQDIEMIAALLRKTDSSYLKAVMKWFFQNDAAEIAKFKAKKGYKYRKLCDLI